VSGPNQGRKNTKPPGQGQNWKSSIDVINDRMAEIEDVKEKSHVTIETIFTKPTPELVDLRMDLQTKGCPVCNHIIKNASGFFAKWQFKIS
jgi:hypothetical protein